MSNNTASTLQLGRPASTGTATKRFKTLRSLPRSWIIAGVIFYCASVITVGLLAGLLPRRTQTITVLATPTQIITTGTPITTTQDPSLCVEDECNPRLLTDLLVDSYELEYMYNDTKQTNVQGQVIIEFTLNQPVRQLIYHSKRMITLEEPALYENGVNRLVSMRKYVPNDYISLRPLTNSSFPAKRYRLIQKFVISLIDGNSGFYQSIFKDGNETMG
jgi:hypothetical protein